MKTLKNKKPFVHSNFDRIKDDNYQTIDTRCINGLVETWDIDGVIADCCARNGSSIVDALLVHGYDANGMNDAFDVAGGVKWIVSNPPYKRGLVDEIINYQIQRIVKDEIYGVAMLLRAQFDFAKSRKEMFNTNLYKGQTHLCFRPIWVEPKPNEKKIEPIHNYVWHVWSKSMDDVTVKYWYEK